MIEVVGWIGGIMLAVCGVPQAIKSYREGHSDGISMGMLQLWGWGEALTIIYVAKTSAQWPLMANYTFNLAIVSIILWYKVFPNEKTGW